MDSGSGQSAVMLITQLETKANHSLPTGDSSRQVIDFFEKELEKLTSKFNKYFGTRICDLQSRQLSMFAILKAGILSRSIRSTMDEKQVGNITREFCIIRDTLNKFFDYIEQQQSERKPHVKSVVRQSVAAGG